MPKDSIATKFQAAKLRTITKEKALQVQEEQTQLKVMHPSSRARLSPAKRAILRGVELEAHHKITGNKDSLAEALAMQGKYNRAAAIAVRPDLKAEYAEKANAVDVDDQDCACDSYVEAGNYHTPNQYVEFYGYSKKHKRVMPFIRCRECGDLNARYMLAHLNKQKRARAEHLGRSKPVEDPNQENLSTDFFSTGKAVPKPSWSK